MLGSVSMAWSKVETEVVMTQKENVVEIKLKCVRLCFKCLRIHSGFGTQQEGIHYWLEQNFGDIHGMVIAGVHDSLPCVTH